MLQDRIDAAAARNGSERWVAFNTALTALIARYYPTSRGAAAKRADVLQRAAALVCRGPGFPETNGPPWDVEEQRQALEARLVADAELPR